MIRLVLLVFVLALPLFAVDCPSLMSKYNAPNPASKTMAQLERWIKNRVDSPKDAALLKECLLAGAADNPNQSSYAGK